jgi:D-glycero-alpha-D-manno-heptose-7-phosphate kinase
MKEHLKALTTKQPITASAPCRIDMGGTLDISTFSYPLHHLSPCTFNIAIDLRTTARLEHHRNGYIKISSRGFESAEFPIESPDFSHPLGLMFAIAVYFRAGGVHIIIDSSSPPRSALGGSSAAGVALIAAFSRALEKMGQTPYTTEEIVSLAHEIEASVAGVPCGRQDQLAAAYGGVHAWHWSGDIRKPVFRKQSVIPESRFQELRDHILIAYCGVPHESKDINGRWVKQFIRGQFRKEWMDIVDLTKKFVEALSDLNYSDAVESMNRETALRRAMTPDVFDEIGRKLADKAVSQGCGVRFTGAGGGGCIWALGETENIRRLKGTWESILAERETAAMLTAGIDRAGLRIEEA